MPPTLNVCPHPRCMPPIPDVFPFLQCMPLFPVYALSPRCNPPTPSMSHTPSVFPNPRCIPSTPSLHFLFPIYVLTSRCKPLPPTYVAEIFSQHHGRCCDFRCSVTLSVGKRTPQSVSRLLSKEKMSACILPFAAIEKQLIFASFQSSLLTSSSGAVINLVLIMLMSNVYTAVAEWLTKWGEPFSF